MDAGMIASNAGAWLWKEYGEDIKGGFTDFLKRKFNDAKEENEKIRYALDRWMDFQWSKASNRYAENLKKRYGYVRVLGSIAPINLDDIFTDLNVLEKPVAFRRYDISKIFLLQSEPERLKSIKQEPGLRILQRKLGQKLFVLGKPGSGKTTFLKFIVHVTMKGKLNKLPIFVTIKDWADSRLELMDFITHQFDLCSFPSAQPFIEYILETGRAILMFDGLDEVRQEGGQRKFLTTHLHAFTQKYQQTQCIITCRVAASDYSFDDFTYVEMADFNDEQMKIYTHNWFGIHTDKAKDFWVELNKAENKGVKELSRSPLLLSMICLAYNETNAIPERRVEIYEEALDALLKKWDSTRNINRDNIYHDLSLGRKRQMFSRIAAQTFGKGKIFFKKKDLANQIESYLKKLPSADIKTDIDGEVVLHAIEAQHGIFTQVAKDIYSFAHLTFQEYYISKFIVDNTNRGSLVRLVTHLSDPRWHEVFILTSSLLDNADGLIKSIQNSITSMIGNDVDILRLRKSIKRKVEGIEGYDRSVLICIYWFINIFIFSSGPRARQSLIIYEKSHFGAWVFDDLKYSKQIRLYDRIITLLTRLTQSLDQSIKPLMVTTDKDEPNNILIQIGLQIKDDLIEESYIKYILLDISLANIIVFAKYISIIGLTEQTKGFKRRLLELIRQIKTEFKDVDNKMVEELRLLELPTLASPEITWQEFGENLRSLSIRMRIIGNEIYLNHSQIILIDEFIQSNQLLVECLKVAYLSEREIAWKNIF